MSLHLIIGPMFAGKSAELIARAEPFRIALKDVQFIKPDIDTRNQGVQSRIGAKAGAISVSSLKDVPKADVYAVDEFHFFPADSANYISKWLDDGAKVFVSALDTTYDGTVFPSLVNLYALKPDEIIIKVAVCDVCFEFNAKYTQIINPSTGNPLTKDLPTNLVEDGRYKYEPRCRGCFIKK